MNFKTLYQKQCGSAQNPDQHSQIFGLSCGASMPTLRISALVLVYFAAKYISSARLNSLRCNKIDIQLNHCIMSDTVSPELQLTCQEWVALIDYL